MQLKLLFNVFTSVILLGACNNNNKVNTNSEELTRLKDTLSTKIQTEPSRIKKKSELKILILSSSPRRGGNSDLLCDQFMKGAKESSHQVEKINLNDMKINFMTNSDYKDRSGMNNSADDVPQIVDKMISADVIVMATPIYFHSMSGQMKTMIDRTYDKYMNMKDKEFYFIITGANTDTENFQTVVQQFEGYLKSLDNPITRGVITASAWEKGSVETTPAMQQAYEMGKNCNE